MSRPLQVPRVVIILNKIWHYRGPVKRFGKVVCWMYDEYTTADTLGKALSNIAYKYKKENGLAPTARVELEKLFMEVEEL